MENTIYLSHVFGPIFLVVGVSLVLNKGHFSKIADDFRGNNALLYIGGLFSLVVGILVLLANYGFENPAEIILTVLGILATFKGVSLIIAPKNMKKMMKKSKWLIDILPAVGILYIFIGVYLSYFGYIVN